MKFVDILLQNSQAKEAKLYGPSKKASEKPETGIVIQNPSAFHVIKDCATMANKYLPHFVFGLYANPLEVLKGKFTRTDIEEFVSSANSDVSMYQLLILILEKAKKYTQNDTELVSAPITNISAGDPYGEYESYTAPANTSKSIDTVTMLCNAFQVTS